MSLIKINKGTYYLLCAACAVFLCLLLTANAYGQDTYLEALTNAAGESYLKPDESIDELQITNIDVDDDVTEYESLLFKMSSEYYHSFLDLERMQQKSVINAYISTNSMDSSIDKLLALSGLQ
ncbi:MAG: hypothetical protein KAJ95_02015 [Gammaproteobacteria bacterium]|nr:hypothetical protein [Gammaproteobacteria bacterium]